MSSRRAQALSRIRRFFGNLKERVNGRSEVTPVIEIQTIQVRPATDVVPSPDLACNEACTSIVVEEPFAITIDNNDGVSHQENNEVHHPVQNRMFSRVRQFVDGIKQRQASIPGGTTRVFERRRMPASETSPSSDERDLAEVVVDDPSNMELVNEEMISNQEQNNDLMRTYHKILYKCGICLVGPGETQRPRKAQMALFWTMAILTLFYRTSKVKSYFVKPEKGITMVEISICIAYFTSIFLVEATWISSSVKSQGDTKKLLEYSKEAAHLFPKSQNKKKTKLRIATIITIAMAYSSVHLVQSNMGWHHWTPEMVLEWRAYRLAQDAIVWTRNSTNSTEEFLDSFTDDINPASVSLGLLSLVVDAVAQTHFQSILGAFMVHSLSLNDKTEEFCEWLSNPNSMMGSQMAEKTWKMYIHLKEDSELKNSIYELVFSSYHASNILLGALFCYECSHFEIHQGLIFYLICNVVRAAIFYIQNAKPHRSNGTFQSWNRTNFRNKTIIEIENHEDITVAMLLDELNTNPIGLRINSIPIGPAMFAELVASALTYFIVLLTAH